MDTRETIRNFLAENFLFAAGQFPFGDDASLLEEGVVDSTGVLEVIAFVEEMFGVSVDDQEIVPQNFDSVSRIAAYLQSKRQTPSADPEHRATVLEA